MVVSKNGKYTLQTQPVGVTNISQGALASVSQYRREILENEINKNNTTSHFLKGSSGLGNVTSTSRTRIEKTANFSSGGGSTSYRGPGDTGRQVPEVYSPLWLNSNLNMPRERATINAWCRTFFALNPIVQNAISLHSTYPISKLNIKCKNPKVNAFFENMIDELDLMNICVQIAQEYWTLGEAFPYAELDESTAKWSRIIIQNPDYMVVKRSVIAGEPLISLSPDENLRKICTGNSASDIQQRMQLNPRVYEHVRRGENIPLSNFYVSHIARKIAPYENRGTGLPVCCFKQLMLFDKLRECHSEDTEFLTKDGWKTINDVMEISKEINPNPEYVNGIQLDDNGEIEGIYKLKDGIEIACYNPETECLEYHVPKELHMSQYEGKMHHFIGKKVDILVSPNHKMYVKEKHWKNKFSQPYKLVKANDLNDNKSYKFLSKVKWNGKKIDNAIVCGKNVPINLYMKVLGYIASEGWVYINERNGRYDRSIGVSQLTSSDCYQDMVDSFSEFANIFDKKVSSYTKICGSGFSENSRKHIWSGRIHGEDIAKFFINEIGNGVKAGSFEKRLPRWVFDLDSETLQILLDALVKGDGTEGVSKYGTNSKNFRYSTVSKELADNVYELAYKCGFVPNICITDSDNRVKEYIVMWSDTVYGNEPNFAAWDRPPSGNGGGAIMKKVDYNGKVWCFETPTGLFITRRNGKVTIQGNSKFAQADNMINPLTLIKVGGGADNYRPTPEDLQMWRNVFEEGQYDKDFKIFTHDGVTVEKIGSASGIYDISGDITQILKEIYVGLMAPSVIMDGGSDTTYTNGGVALDVLRQRYMTFRNMLSSWLRRKIFAPISKLNDFYDLVDGEKVLIVPEVEWNHMSLFDMSDYINNLSGLLTGETKKVSLQSMYKSLGLEYEDEMRKIRKENIDEMIQLKEKESLSRMSLNDLRSISDSDTIEEVTESPLPGENPYGDPTQGGGGGGLGLPGGPGGGFDLGGPPGGGMGDLGGPPGGGGGMPSL
jgi:hypothetical protein